MTATIEHRAAVKPKVASAIEAAAASIELHTGMKPVMVGTRVQHSATFKLTRCFYLLHAAPSDEAANTLWRLFKDSTPVCDFNVQGAHVSVLIAKRLPEAEWCA